MDDRRIRELTEEVLARLRDPGAPGSADLEARVAALERAVARLQGAAAEPSAEATVVHVSAHPSHRLLNVAGGEPEGRCVMEPDKPCVQSGQCRTLGH